MTELHRVFGSDDPDNEQNRRRPQPKFTLKGRRISNGEAWEETFTCVEQPPVGQLDAIVGSVRTDQQGRRTFDAPSLVRFLHGVVVKEDEDRLMNLVYDKDRPILIDALGDTTMWLSEVYGERPTGRSSS